ncbi:hypothetical protein [Truepera radiovictrix]|uniref:hypothetical protein n=1 Tax=Truepera radiovictrix TaxID=332249 RepID=UPI0011D093FA|nr:hypothetical protein [Truepera radiovictrix]WMT57757.1 hypothetical protein RCV51_02135 [Truepera radiovictrix]
MASFLVLTTLTGCFMTLPPYISLMLLNSEDMAQEPSCPGGIKARLKIGTILVETPVVERGRYGEGVTLPDDVRVGTPAELEVWCYDEGQQGGGYIRIAKPLQPSSAADLLIFPDRPGVDRSLCVRGVEEVDPVPCVRTQLL